MSRPLAWLYPRLPGTRFGPQSKFWNAGYLRLTQRRLEHLASLGLPLCGKSVLEVGAGIGDHTGFFLDRSCQVTTTDGRQRTVAELRERFPDAEVKLLDLEEPPPDFDRTFEIVYCYGMLYHLSRPEEALEFLAHRCSGMLLLESCVSGGNTEEVNLTRERAFSPTASVSGVGCRPTRPWILTRLKRRFPHVYMPTTQPLHEQFPLDWRFPFEPGELTRAVFIASRASIDNPLLLEQIPEIQVGD